MPKNAATQTTEVLTETRIIPPENASKIDEFLDKMAVMLGSVADRKATVAERPPAQDRENWTTPKEAEDYEAWMDQDFVELDPKTGKKLNQKTRYRLLHVFPEFQTVNAAEYKAKFFVEKWNRHKDEQTGKWTRNIETSFQIYAKDFLQTHALLGADPREEGE